MSLYYSDEHVTLYHGDCLTEHREWLDADVLVTDPPYGTQFSDVNPRGGYGRRQDAQHRGSKHAPAQPGMGAWIAGDNGTKARDSMLALWAGKPACLFGSPRLPDPPGNWADRLVWDKKRPGMNGGPWRYRHESIYVTAGFVRTSDASVSIFTVWPDQADHIHAKPLALMTALVAAAPPGVIADPFAGSCTTLVAAAHLGRKAVGVELEERYCELLAKRLSQGALFGGVT